MKRFSVRKVLLVACIIALIGSLVLPAGILAASTANDVFGMSNLLVNASFEQTQNSDENEGNPFTGWESNSVPVSESWAGFFPASEARTNKTAATAWCAVGYTLTVSQEVNVDKAGKYEASIWVSRGTGKLGESVLNIKSGDNIVGSAKLSASEKNSFTEYRQLIAKDINISTAGTYTFEIISNIVGNAEIKEGENFKNNLYIRLDDAFFGVQANDGNVLNNGSFEKTANPDVNDGNAFVGWNAESVPVEDSWTSFFPIAEESKVGSTAGAAWCGVGYTLTVSQDVEISTAGNYDASIMISRGPANQGESTLNIKSGDMVIASAKIGAADKNDYLDYRKISIKDIKIEKAGTYTFELVSVTTGLVDTKIEGNESFNNNAYVRLDDAYLGISRIINDKLINSNFETTQKADENDGNSFAGWISESVPVEDSWTACFPAGESMNGSVAATSWCGVGYGLTVSQEVKIDKAGKYDASIWISRGPANQGESTLSIKDGDTVIAKEILPASDKNSYLNYRRILLNNVEINKPGTYTFELVSIVSSLVDTTVEENKDFMNNAYIRLDEAAFAPVVENTSLVIKTDVANTANTANTGDSNKTEDKSTSNPKTSDSSLIWMLGLMGISGFILTMSIIKKASKSNA